MATLLFVNLMDSPLGLADDGEFLGTKDQQSISSALSHLVYHQQLHSRLRCIVAVEWSGDHHWRVHIERMKDELSAAPLIPPRPHTPRPTGHLSCRGECALGCRLPLVEAVPGVMFKIGLGTVEREMSKTKLLRPAQVTTAPASNTTPRLPGRPQVQRERQLAVTRRSSLRLDQLTFSARGRAIHAWVHCVVWGLQPGFVDGVWSPAVLPGLLDELEQAKLAGYIAHLEPPPGGADPAGLNPAQVSALTAFRGLQACAPQGASAAAAWHQFWCLVCAAGLRAGAVLRRWQRR